MEIIDGHVNVTDEGKWGTTTFDASVTALLEEMDAAGIHKALLLPVRNYASNQFIAQTVGQWPARFIGFGNLSVHSWRDDLKEVLDLGLCGIKFHPRMQIETLEQWDQSGILSNLEVAGLVLNVCGWLQSRTIPISQLTPLVVDVIAKKYPRLQIILSHLGGHHYWDAFFAARSNPNLYLDTSYFTEFFEKTSLERDFYHSVAKIDQKIIYGSDFPEVSPSADLKRFRAQIRERDCDLKGILAGNLRRALSMPQ